MIPSLVNRLDELETHSNDFSGIRGNLLILLDIFRNLNHVHFKHLFWLLYFEFVIKKNRNGLKSGQLKKEEWIVQFILIYCLLQSLYLSVS